MGNILQAGGRSEEEGKRKRRGKGRLAPITSLLPTSQAAAG